jgi:hypothetical protein
MSEAGDELGLLDRVEDICQRLGGLEDAVWAGDDENVEGVLERNALKEEGFKFLAIALGLGGMFFKTLVATGGDWTQAIWLTFLEIIPIMLVVFFILFGGWSKQQAQHALDKVVRHFNRKLGIRDDETHDLREQNLTLRRQLAALKATGDDAATEDLL